MLGGSEACNLNRYIRHKALWIFIQFPSGCCFVLLRPDAVPFGLLRHSSRLFGVFLKPLRVLFELLGSLLGASCLPCPYRRPRRIMGQTTPHPDILILNFEFRGRFIDIHRLRAGNCWL